MVKIAMKNSGMILLMSEEEFLDFVDEYEKTPEILFTTFGNNIYKLLPTDIEAKISNFHMNNVIIT